MAGVLRFLAVSLALGVIGYFACEAMFWSFRPEGATVGHVALISLAYALTGGAALSAVLWAGLAGWRAAFLGGAVMGFGVEGAVVGTMYDAMPMQLVWTPLAWQALISGLLVFAGALASARWALGRQLALMLALGLFGGVWSLYWPLVRPVLPPSGVIWAYLMGCGVAALVALVAVDRLLPGLSVPRWALWVLPVVLGLLFVVQTIADPRPQRVIWPVLMLATVWAMRRLGRPGAEVAPGPPAPLWRHLPLLIVPAGIALIASATAGLGGVAINLPVALLSGAAALGLWVRLLWQAYRARA